jgi:hypothetical protein
LCPGRCSPRTFNSINRIWPGRYLGVHHPTVSSRMRRILPSHYPPAPAGVSFGCDDDSGRQPAVMDVREATAEDVTPESGIRILPFLYSIRLRCAIRPDDFMMSRSAGVGAGGFSTGDLEAMRWEPITDQLESKNFGDQVTGAYIAGKSWHVHMGCSKFQQQQWPQAFSGSSRSARHFSGRSGSYKARV